MKLLLVISSILVLIQVTQQAKLDDLMQVCVLENESRFTKEQLDEVYDIFANTLPDEKEFQDLIKESSDLFKSNMETDNEMLKERYIDQHMIRVCVMYEMLKRSLANEN